MDSKRKAVNKLPKELRRIPGYNVSNKCRLDLGRHANYESALVSDQNSVPGHDRILHETSLVIVNSQPAQTYTQPSYLSELDVREYVSAGTSNSIHENSCVRSSSKVARVSSSSHPAMYSTGYHWMPISNSNETRSSHQASLPGYQYKHFGQTTGTRECPAATSQYHELQAGFMASKGLSYSMRRYLETNPQSHETNRALEEIDRYFPQQVPSNSFIDRPGY
ncbi:hypothetical protein H109_02023 [Trichophyton interdigitale MR816]|uniref:Uncharacterized protein n=1 Tax=Trichophyton interdigitale (strain MR816) TaxID=1215338 RepID=A0A059JEH6_TRIIM|nr:hypothetical protein H101_05121 [Trichophyton interdigitale H6]KDB26174.1 hypothetical protein H109_02023 [Trichophyton interdigitale MR816]